MRFVAFSIEKSYKQTTCIDFRSFSFPECQAVYPAEKNCCMQSPNIAPLLSSNPTITNNMAS